MLIAILFCCALGLAYDVDKDGYNYDKPSIVFSESIPTTHCPSEYTGQYPNCIPPPQIPTPSTQVSQQPTSPQQCPEGSTGQYPYCQIFAPSPTLPSRHPSEQCPFGTIGQYPYCEIPPPIQCPTGTIGQYPYCEVNLPSVCPQGTIGEYPYCELPPPIQCPTGTIGQYPYCEVPLPSVCPHGSTGQYPNCELLPPLQSSSPVDSCIIGWEEFKVTFNKTYGDVNEELKRQKLFLENQQLITEHNALHEQGKETYSLCVNRFADWTDEEYEHLNGIDDSELSYARDNDQDESEEEGFGR